MQASGHDKGRTSHPGRASTCPPRPPSNAALATRLSQTLEVLSLSGKMSQNLELRTHLGARLAVWSLIMLPRTILASLFTITDSSHGKFLTRMGNAILIQDHYHNPRKAPPLLLSAVSLAKADCQGSPRSSWPWACPHKSRCLPSGAYLLHCLLSPGVVIIQAGVELQLSTVSQLLFLKFCTTGARGEVEEATSSSYKSHALHSKVKPQQGGFLISM